jgi:hypothetical protein
MSQICHSLHQLFNSLTVFRFPFNAKLLPQNGIYILFEDGEQAHGTNRIVRVGTHTGDNQLPASLQQHFVKENKDRSIFRKNIGRAILSRNQDPFLDWWGFDLTTSEAKRIYMPALDLARQKQVERQVSEYIKQHLRFVVFRVDEKKDWIGSQKLYLRFLYVPSVGHPLPGQGIIRQKRRSGKADCGS